MNGASKNPRAIADVAWRQAQAMAEAHGAKDWHAAALAQTALAEALNGLIKQPRPWVPPPPDEKVEPAS